MNKVTIVITKDGWGTTVEIGDHKATETHKKNYTGSKSEGPRLEQDEKVPDELYEAISDAVMPCHDIMNALNDIE